MMRNENRNDCGEYYRPADETLRSDRLRAPSDPSLQPPLLMKNERQAILHDLLGQE